MVFRRFASLLFSMEVLCHVCISRIIRNFPCVGWFMDVTRGRIPKMAYLKELADRCSLYKINQLHLYIEHTFLFDGLSEVWRDDTRLQRRIFLN